MSSYLVQLKGMGDERGLLVAIEAKKTIPFEIKRTYYLTGLKKDHPRGFHAHKKLQQLAICLKGSCRFIMDNGKQKEEFIINNPTTGVTIDPMIWHEMHDFSEDCVLMVLASDYYDESDYIRNYETFKELV